MLTEHCLWLRRGYVYTIDNQTFLTIGGAHSIDKLWRKPNISWWKDEDITRWDIKRAKQNLAKYNNTVDYVLTHCAPTPVHQEIAKQERFSHADKEETRNEVLLQEINEIINFKKWYFGHYHIDREFENGKYACLYHEIRPLL